MPPLGPTPRGSPAGFPGSCPSVGRVGVLSLSGRGRLSSKRLKPRAEPGGPLTSRRVPSPQVPGRCAGLSVVACPSPHQPRGTGPVAVGTQRQSLRAPGLRTWLGGSRGREGSGSLPGPAVCRGGGAWTRRWGGASAPTFLGGALTEVPCSSCRRLVTGCLCPPRGSPPLEQRLPLCPA